jgi:hypothetical protein
LFSGIEVSEQTHGGMTFKVQEQAGGKVKVQEYW